MSGPSHERRRLSFGANATEYERFRPTYPDAAIRFVLGNRPLRVLDLGAGTGLLTRRLASHGHDVLAVEPDPQMLRVLTESLPIEALVGHAEDIPLGDKTADAVTIGQAYHWFDRQKALPEIGRVLRPGGVLGVFWNVLDDRVPWVDALCQLTGGEARWSRIHTQPDPDLQPWFRPAARDYFPLVQSLTPDELVGLVATWSFVGLRDDREELLTQVRRMVQKHPDTDGQHRLSLPYLTSTFRTTLV